MTKYSNYFNYLNWINVEKLWSINMLMKTQHPKVIDLSFH